MIPPFVFRRLVYLIVFYPAAGLLSKNVKAGNRIPAFTNFTPYLAFTQTLFRLVIIGVITDIIFNR